MDPAQLLEHHLKDQGLSASQFAARIGVNRSTVSEVLNGNADLSRVEWGRWFGALGLKLTYGAAPASNAGFFTGPDDVYPWMHKRLVRSRKPAPVRARGEVIDVLERAGLNLGEADTWVRLLPMHLAPILESGWLWREGPDTTQSLAARVADAWAAG